MLLNQPPVLKGFVLLFAAAAVAACADGGPLRVGAARAEWTDLSPAPSETKPSGKYEHEKLFLRAIVLDNGTTRAALVTMDGGGIRPEMPEKVAAELKCPVENVIVSATHSHSAGRIPPGTQRVEPPAVTDRLLQVVREAVSKLQPARVAFGKGASYLNVNRDVISPKTRLWTQDADPEGPSDKTVYVLKFENMTGDPIAIYFSYAMHPVNGYLIGITSADWPGAATRFIEQLYDDKVVVAFTNGAEGDQNPLYLRAATAALWRRSGGTYAGQPQIREEVEAEIRDKGKKTVALDQKAADDLERVMEAMGIIVAEEVLRVAHSLKATDSNVRLAGYRETISCPGRVRTDQGREGTPGTYKDGPDAQMAVGVLGIGNYAVANSQGEVYNAIWQRFLPMSPMSNIMFAGIAGQSTTGYIPSDDAFGHNSFQVLGSKLKPGCAETSIQNKLAEFVNRYVSGK